MTHPTPPAYEGVAPGRCTLVGAGPGDPELLTIKALKAIQAATVLLVDDLVSDEIVAMAPPGARVVHVASAAAARARRRPSSKSSWSWP